MTSLKLDLCYACVSMSCCDMGGHNSHYAFDSSSCVHLSQSKSVPSLHSIDIHGQTCLAVFASSAEEQSPSMACTDIKVLVSCLHMQLQASVLNFCQEHMCFCSKQMGRHV